MEDLAHFAAVHPEFCDPKAVRVPGHGQVPALEGSRPFELTPENLSIYRVEAAKDATSLPAMLKLGPEAVAFYVSFRLAPERWGVYIREGGLRALKEEYHRIIWRDLGKYADKNVDDVADKVETTLVLDYVLAHNRVHFVIDRWAADQEAADGKARYAAYQAAWYAAPPKPAMVPEDVGNVEEWKAFFIGGRFAVEMANVFSRQPPGWKDFARFLNRKTSVGATNYVRIQYSYNPEMLERGQKELSQRLGGSKEAPNLFKTEAPSFPNVYLL